LGKSSKPLTIHIDKSLYDANELVWIGLREQGHDIVVVDGGLPDLYLAPYAHRMTADMLLQLPSSFTLAVTGARALRYAPTAKDPTAWKGAKGAKAKGTRTRKNSTIKTETINNGEPPTQAENKGTGGAAVSPASTTPNDKGATQTE
jgi:hypothetical protein